MSEIQNKAITDIQTGYQTRPPITFALIILSIVISLIAYIF